MTRNLLTDILPAAGETIDPFELARRDQTAHLPKKFYTHAAAEPGEAGFTLVLDGRPARTPARNLLSVPARALCESLAAEWNDVTDVIDPARMPISRIVNSALDGVAQQEDAVAEDVVKYAGTDLLCYRAGEPQSLVEEQSAAWDPVIVWARDELGARLVLAEGVMHVAQPEDAIAAVRTAVTDMCGAGAVRPLRLTALHVMTTLTGSALLALATAHGRLAPEVAWKAAHVDEDHQIRRWGEDEEAMARRARRWREMEAAARVFFQAAG